jgi:hypothetical protein
MTYVLASVFKLLTPPVLRMKYLPDEYVALAMVHFAAKAFACRGNIIIIIHSKAKEREGGPAGATLLSFITQKQKRVSVGL